MDRAAALNRLRASEPELRALGLSSLSLFGSTARGEAGPMSDVDLAARFFDADRVDLFQVGEISERLRLMLGAPVDLVTEPAQRPGFQAEIDRDRVNVF